MNDLKQLLGAKADRLELEHIGAQKANKQDMEHAMQAIDIIHKQQAHIIVLLIESVKT